MQAKKVLTALAAVAVGAGALWGRAARGAPDPQSGPVDLFEPTPPHTFSLQSAPPTTNNLGTFNIVIVPGAGLSANAPALAAFNRAALAWSSRISDPITVTINADLSTTDPNGNPFAANIIGSTSSVSLQGGYDTIRNQLVADSNTQVGGLANKSAISALPAAAQFTATLPAGRSLSGNVVLTKANAKAMGFTGLDAPPASGGFGPSDATVVFNSAFTFDYDNTNGVSAGQIDFQTAATHEIGHVLGFTSSVDTVDTTTAATNPTISPTVLDLFRFDRSGTNHPVTLTDYTNKPRDLSPGVDTVTSDLSQEFRMSTGLNGGDGQQASHWKDDSQTGSFIGIMDPTLSSGTTEPVTDADFRAMDLIGYDVTAVPEPAALGICAVACAGLLARRRRVG